MDSDDKQRSAGWQTGMAAWKGLAAVLVVVTAAATGWFFWKSGLLTRTFNDHYARTIARFGREVELRAQSYRNVVVNLTPLTGASGDDGPVSDPQIRQNVLPSKRDLVETCLAQPDSQEAGAGQVSRDLCVAKGLIRGNEAAVDSAPRALDLQSCKSKLRGVVLLNESSLTFTPKPGPALDVCGRITLSQLLMGLGPEQGGLDRTAPHTFEALALLDDRGRVLVGPSGDSPLRLLKLPGFDEKRATASHVMSEVALGPRKYSVFLQPLDLSLVSACSANIEGCSADGKRPAQLLLAGLVFEDRLANERLEVAPGTYLWAVVLLSLIVLALPLAKLWLLGPNSRLRRFDVSLLVASSAAATLLVTLLSLSGASFFQLRATVDRDLQQVGVAVATAVERRTADGVSLLDEFLAATPLQQQAVAASDPVALGEACGPPASFVPALAACERRAAPLRARPEARWEQAFLADAEGRQRVKWSANDATTNLVSVARRGYFKGARERACSSGQSCGDAHAVEVVRSLTTGSLQLVVAKAFLPTAARDGGAGGVAGITLPLREFQAPVLPLGFQVAVIDREGKVMLHSGSLAFQGQNFLDEVDAPAALRAAMSKQSESSLTLRYLGERSRVRVASLPVNGWSVLVVAPFSLIDLPLSQSVLMTVAAFVLVAIVALVLFGAILFIAGRRRLFRRLAEQDTQLTLRPRAASRHDYEDATRFMLAGVLAPVLALLLPYGLVPLVVLVPCALVAFGALMRVPGLGRNGALSSLRPDGNGAFAKIVRKYCGEATTAPRGGALAKRASFVSVYATCCFALAFTVVTAPACALFAGAHDHMLETLARAQQQHLARASVPLDCLGASEQPRPACSRFFLTRSNISADEDTWGAETRNALLAPAQNWLPEFEPVRGSAAALLVLARAPAEPPRVPWQWQRAGCHLRLGPLGLAKSKGGAGLAGKDQAPLFLHSEVPTLTGWCLMLPLLGLGLWAAASYLLSLRVFKRLFQMKLLTQLGQHSLEDLAIVLGNYAAAANAPIRVYVPNLSSEDLTYLEYELEKTSGERKPVWTRNQLFRPAAPRMDETEQPEPSWLIATFDHDPLQHADGMWLELLRDYDEQRLAPRVDPHLATLAVPKRAALHKLWQSCDEDEKRVLSQIALDDYANPHPNTALVLKRLAEKGLIDPSTLAIPRRAFVEFILSTLEPADFEYWAKSEKNTSWSAMRGVLIAAVATLAAVLTALQPTLGAATATVPALAAAIPTLLRVLNVFAGSEAK